MKKTSDLSDHIKRTMPKRDIQEGRESVQMFVEMLKHHKIDVVDDEVLNRTYETEDYRLLIKLIMKQKNNEIPKELEVFWEDQYLSPVILFEMFRLFDVYAELRGRPAVYRDHPTPQERQENIFSMFKDDVPEEMNEPVISRVFHPAPRNPAGCVSPCRTFPFGRDF